MVQLQSLDDSSKPVLRREVLVPKAKDALAFHRRIAVLSILVALLAGTIDAMLWREAQLRAERERIETYSARQIRVDVASEHAMLTAEYEVRRLRRELEALARQAEARRP